MTLRLIILALISLLTATAGNAADTFTVGSFVFEQTSSDECTVISPSETVSDVVIPSLVNTPDGTTLTVTAIAPNAFDGNRTIRSVSIPPSVRSIGADAFHACHWLRTVSISDIGAWCTISFANECANPLWGLRELQLNGRPVTDVKIPLDVTRIADYAFADCATLRSVLIHDGVTYIGRQAFDGCESLESVTMGRSVSTIGDAAFNICVSLRQIALPPALRRIGETAFYGCTALTAIDIPEGVTELHEAAFAGCTSLCSVSLPSSLSVIGSYAFHHCPALESVTLPDRLMAIHSYAFDSCTALRSIELPSSITLYGLYIFNSCTGLREATLPEGLTQVPEGLFINCTGLESVAIPASVTSIADYAFAGCASLPFIKLPQSLTKIGARSFYGCTRLADIEFGPEMQSISSETFYLCPALERVTSRAITPPMLSYFAFDISHDRNCRVYVPQIALADYREAFAWRNFDRLEGRADLNPDTRVTIAFEGSGGSISRIVNYGKTLTLSVARNDGRLPDAVYFNDIDITSSLSPDGTITTPPVTAPSTLRIL